MRVAISALVGGAGVCVALARAQLWLAAIVVGLVFAVIAFSAMGASLGERFETPDLGWGTTDVGLGAMLRVQRTPSWLGAWLGMIPVLLFVTVLIVMAHSG